MNKLDVAIKLLQLLNERNSVNSKIVADELNVSLRTAQRYLLELSVMPCVVTLHNNHTYSLDPRYKVSDALLSGNNLHTMGVQAVSNQATKQSQALCLICSQKNNTGGNKPVFCPGNPAVFNNYAIDKLVSIIKKKLGTKRRVFP